MKHKKPFFKASVQNDTLEMLVYEEIGNDPWTGTGVSALDVKRQIDSAGSFAKVLVRINSPGGDAFEGIAIGNLIKSLKKPVHVCIDGIAASAASIIAMAGDTIEMGSNAMVMIHNAWSVAIGDSVEMRKTADLLDKISASIAQTYVDKTGKALAEVQAMMDAETWMSAKDCVENGFATTVGNDDQEAMMFARSFKTALARHKALPDQLKNAVCACNCENCLGMDCQNCSLQDCENADCIGCPNQAEELPGEPSNLSQYEARLKLLSLR